MATVHSDHACLVVDLIDLVIASWAIEPLGLTLIVQMLLKCLIVAFEEFAALERAPLDCEILALSTVDAPFLILDDLRTAFTL